MHTCDLAQRRRGRGPIHSGAPSVNRAWAVSCVSPAVCLLLCVSCCVSWPIRSGCVSPAGRLYVRVAAGLSDLDDGRRCCSPAHTAQRGAQSEACCTVTVSRQQLRLDAGFRLYRFRLRSPAVSGCLRLRCSCSSAILMRAPSWARGWAGGRPCGRIVHKALLFGL